MRHVRSVPAEVSPDTGRLGGQVRSLVLAPLTFRPKPEVGMTQHDLMVLKMMAGTMISGVGLIAIAYGAGLIWRNWGW
ncbi:hypothetical protein ACVMIH_000066 [Bradyrhizobium sp. USDA 4503]